MVSQLRFCLKMVFGFSVLAMALASPDLHAKSYRGHLRKATKHKQLYSIGDAKVKILWHGTYFSPDFRKAYVMEFSKRKFLDRWQVDLLIEEHKRRSLNGHEFFVEMYTPKDYKQFSMGKESFWQAVVTTQSGEILKPISINTIDVTPFEKEMFPYLDRWSHAYLVVFPKEELGKKFTLTLRSAIGQTHLKFSR